MTVCVCSCKCLTACECLEKSNSERSEGRRLKINSLSVCVPGLAVTHAPKYWSDWSICALICAQQLHLAHSQGGKTLSNGTVGCPIQELWAYRSLPSFSCPQCASAPAKLSCWFFSSCPVHTYHSHSALISSWNALIYFASSCPITLYNILFCKRHVTPCPTCPVLSFLVLPSPSQSRPALSFAVLTPNRPATLGGRYYFLSCHYKSRV